MTDMIRKIIIPKERTYTLEIPESFLGKEVEILAFEVSEEKNTKSYTVNDQNEKLKRLTEMLKGCRVDLSDFIFGRNQANDYE